MYSAYKLNKQGDNIQPWCTPFPIWNQSIVPCPVLIVASWPAYRFLNRQARWSGIPNSKNFPQFVVIYTVKGFAISNKAEVDVFSGILLLSLWSSRCWQFDLWEVHSSHTVEAWLENFDHYFASVWDECNCAVVWTFFPGGLDSKVSVYNAGDLCSIPWLGRSPGEGNGNTLQYCCLENPMDRGAW